MIYRKKLAFIMSLLLTIAVPAVLFAEKKLDQGDEPQPPQIPQKYANLVEIKEWQIQNLVDPWISQDNNDDGSDDSAYIVSDEDFYKVREILDLNFDGFGDDFAYFNKSGKIEFQEIDSNYDKKVDIWVEIYNGIRVVSIQQDIDFDGLVDIARFY